MRTFLLTTAALLALTAPARAIGVVYDPVQDTQGIQELAKWVQQLSEMQRQYEQLVSTYKKLYAN